MHRGLGDVDGLPLLLSALNDKPGSPVPNTVTSTHLIQRLLSRDDYVEKVELLNEASDVKDLLDFILHLLRDRLFPNQDPIVDINRRARRFMFKLISKLPVIPPSLIVTGVTLPAERDYIGSGGFGRVFKGELGGKPVALKVLYKTENQVAFCKEALMWGSLKHKFVLPFLGIYEIEEGTAPQLFLVSPYMTNGTLAQWRKNAKPSIAEVEERMLQVAQGVEYIHSEGVVHGDLRGENILLDADRTVQIADFGLTRLLDATNTQSGSKHLNFAAPELFGCLEDDDDSSAEDPTRTQMSDVYAFGCLYYEIHYDIIPFSGKQEIQIMALVFRGKRPPRLAEPPLRDESWDVIQRCWAKEPAERPRMKDVAESLTVISTPPSFILTVPFGDAQSNNAFLTSDQYEPVCGFYAPTDGFYAPTDGFYAPTDGFYAPTDGFYAPTDRFYTPTDRFYTPTDGFTSELPFEEQSLPSDLSFNVTTPNIWNHLLSPIFEENVGTSELDLCVSEENVGTSVGRHAENQHHFNSLHPTAQPLLYPPTSVFIPSDETLLKPLLIPGGRGWTSSPSPGPEVQSRIPLSKYRVQEFNDPFHGPHTTHTALSRSSSAPNPTTRRPLHLGLSDGLLNNLK